jgi:hypothetical protein
MTLNFEFLWANRINKIFLLIVYPKWSDSLKNFFPLLLFSMLLLLLVYLACRSVNNKPNDQLGLKEKNEFLRCCYLMQWRTNGALLRISEQPLEFV